MGIFLRLLAFLAPFLVFFGLVWLVRRFERAGRFRDPRTARRLILAFFATAVVITGLIFYVAARRPAVDPRSLHYVPPHYEEGRIVPEEFDRNRRPPKRPPEEPSDDGSS